MAADVAMSRQQWGTPVLTWQDDVNPNVAGVERVSFGTLMAKVGGDIVSFLKI